MIPHFWLSPSFIERIETFSSDAKTYLSLISAISLIAGLSSIAYTKAFKSKKLVSVLTDYTKNSLQPTNFHVKTRLLFKLAAVTFIAGIFFAALERNFQKKREKTEAPLK